MRDCVGALMGSALLCAAATCAHAQIPLSPTAQASGAQLSTTYGIEFVTIGAPGNAPYPGDPDLENNNFAANRGGVDYAYRIGRYEITTAQWAAFYNAVAFVSATQGNVPHVQAPSFWGGVSAPNPYGAGLGWTVPAGSEMRPVGGISWRTAAIYCNWLCNGQALTRDAFMSGAYDVSTFGYQGKNFTDQFAHTPGARFWIPTWDEWLKAAHYDPNRYGPGQGGYWSQPNASDTALTLLPPWFGGQANTGWRDLNNSQWSLPLGSYANVQSPWGLLDVAGATGEWTESVLTLVDGRHFRYVDGSWWGSATADSRAADQLDYPSAGDFPSLPYLGYGLRIASSVPSPGAGMSTLLFLVPASSRALRRRSVCLASGAAAVLACSGAALAQGSPPRGCPTSRSRPRPRPMVCSGRGSTGWSL